MLTDQTLKENYLKFENLYNTFAPKIFGFIMGYTETKEQSEMYMEKIFQQVWRDINYFDSNAEQKLVSIALLICKPAIKSKRQKHQMAIQQVYE